MEAFYHLHPDDDEHRAHEHGADDAPEEDAVLVARLDLEVGEDEDEHEDVVHAEAELDQVAGEKLLGGFGSAPLPEQPAETEGKRHPDAAPREGLFHADDVRLALKHPQIEGEHCGDEGEKSDPSPQRHGVDDG